ncbi:MAG: hypothetical protein JKX76_02290 [Colwellia sp.]|nr:hypothetical protein [Colwellia sp.]
MISRHHNKVPIWLQNKTNILFPILENTNFALGTIIFQNNQLNESPEPVEIISTELNIHIDLVEDYNKSIITYPPVVTEENLKKYNSLIQYQKPPIGFRCESLIRYQNPVGEMKDFDESSEITYRCVPDNLICGLSQSHDNDDSYKFNKEPEFLSRSTSEASSNNSWELLVSECTDPISNDVI